MGLETGEFISDLVQTNPVTATDPVSEGSDHIRLLKKTLQQSVGLMPGLLQFAENNKFFSQSNVAADDFVNMIKINLNDHVQLGDVGAPIVLAGDAINIVQNNAPIQGNNVALDTLISMIKVNTADEIEFGLVPVVMPGGKLTIKDTTPSLVLSNDTAPTIVFDRPAGQSYRVVNEGGLLRWYTGTPGEASVTNLVMQLNGQDFAVVLGDLSMTSGKFDAGSQSAQSLGSPGLSMRNGSAIRMNMWVEGDTTPGLSNDEIYLQGTNTNFHFISSGNFPVMTLDLSNASVGAVIFGNLVGGGNVSAAADGTLILA